MVILLSFFTLKRFCVVVAAGADEPLWRIDVTEWDTWKCFRLLGLLCVSLECKQSSSSLLPSATASSTICDAANNTLPEICQLTFSTQWHKVCIVAKQVICFWGLCKTTLACFVWVRYILCLLYRWCSVLSLEQGSRRSEASKVGTSSAKILCMHLFQPES